MRENPSLRHFLNGGGKMYPLLPEEGWRRRRRGGGSEVLIEEE
jgi:hypothetical protein